MSPWAYIETLSIYEKAGWACACAALGVLLVGCRSMCWAVLRLWRGGLGVEKGWFFLPGSNEFQVRSKAGGRWVGRACLGVSPLPLHEGFVEGHRSLLAGSCGWAWPHRRQE